MAVPGHITHAASHVSGRGRGLLVVHITCNEGATIIRYSAIVAEHRASVAIDHKHSAPEDWSRIDIHILEDMVREAELYIHNQTATAQSLDQRATSLCAIACAGSVALLVLVFDEFPHDGVQSQAIFMYLLIALWFITAIVSGLAHKPRDWQSSGSLPSSSYDVIKADKWSRTQILGAYVELLDEYCNTNRKSNERRATMLSWALCILVASPAIALALTFIMMNYFACMIPVP